MWILALVWIGFALLQWQLYNIPIYHGGRLHY